MCLFIVGVLVCWSQVKYALYVGAYVCTLVYLADILVFAELVKTVIYMIFSENKLVDRVSLVLLRIPAFRVNRRFPVLKLTMVFLLYCVYDTRQVVIILCHPHMYSPKKKEKKKK